MEYNGNTGFRLNLELRFSLTKWRNYAGIRALKHLEPFLKDIKNVMKTIEFYETNSNADICI